MAFWKKPILPEQNVAPATTPAVTEAVVAPTVTLEQKPTDSRLANLRSALSEGTVIQGKLSFDTPVRIDGKLHGHVFSSDSLLVGPKGEIQAEIEVAELIVKGTVRGNIKASRRVEIHAGASVSGTIETPILVLEQGGMLDAEISMGRDRSGELAGPSAPASETETFAEQYQSEEARLH